MNKRKKRLLVGGPVGVLILVVLMTFAFSIAWADPDYDAWGTDRTGILDPTSSVKQDGNPIPEDGTISSESDILVTVSLDVPVVGDDTGGPYVEHNDYAEWEISDAFEVTDGAIPMETSDGTHVATAYIWTNSSGMVMATVHFDGAENIFDGTGDWTNVKASFRFNMSYDKSGSGGSSGTHEVTILEKDYEVLVPAAERVYTVEKSNGTVDLANREVTWTVVITGDQGGSALDLGGFTFSDDLTGVGAYIANSFTVGGSAATPDESGNTISYTFSPGTMSPQTISFRTYIEDANYYATGQQTITNTGRLVSEEEEVDLTDQGTATFNPPTWINKSGSVTQSGSSDPSYDPENRQITWYIRVNSAGAALNGVTITDTLPTNLPTPTFVKAYWQIWDDDTDDWVTSTNPDHTWSAEPDGGVYEIGNITTEGRLVIVTDVPKQEWVVSTKSYQNDATVRWEDGGPYSDSATVSVGYTGLSKTSPTYSVQNQTIDWSVTVNPRGQTIPNLVAYDLIVYGPDSDSLSGATGFPGNINQSELLPRYNQRIVSGSLSATGMATATVIPIELGGVRVADLVQVTGFPTDTATTFSFTTKVLDPNIFARNGNVTVYNDATLWGGSDSDSLERLATASANRSFQSRLLEKDMLVRESEPETVAGANTRTTDAYQGFDYEDKSVIFRLSVNSSGLDFSALTQGAGDTPLGDAIVTDTLPPNWEFVPFSSDPNDMYRIYEGEPWSSTGSYVVRAMSGPLTSVPGGLTTDFTPGTAVFTFGALDQPYVILVKARPSDALLDTYFSTSGAHTVTNRVNLKTENWEPSTAVTATQNVTVESELLAKLADLLEAGVVEWTIEYRPYDLESANGVRIRDVIPVGLDLRTDSSGNLLLDGINFRIYEMTLQPDGTYVSTGSNLVPDTVVPRWDSATRVLEMDIPQPDKAYRFIYITDVTGDPGTTLTNRVSLCGGEGELESDSDSWVVTEEDGYASMQRAGWIEIIKLGDGDPLPGAGFHLLTPDGETIIRQGVTNLEGKLRWKAIPAGEYILREVTVPGGYLGDNTDHTVVVEDNDGIVVTIDGEVRQGRDITIHNYGVGTGQLTILKTVAGTGADPTRGFEFTVTFEGDDIVQGQTFNYIGYGVPDGSIANGGTITLAGGQSIKITGIPAGATYSVVETPDDAYTTSSTGDEGEIPENEEAVAAFTNTFREGDLTISKTVAGNGGSYTKEFTFTVTFSGDAHVQGTAYPYVGNGGADDGTLASGGTVTLTHGQSITFHDLPEGLEYQVEEEDYSADGYVTSSTGEEGTIIDGETQAANFTNVRSVAPDPEDEAGRLTITKTVEGATGETQRQFTFTVTFSGSPGAAYPYTGAVNGTIQSGGTVSLAHGQSITITGIPIGTTYTVTEYDYSGEGYTTSASGSFGEITGRGATAGFVNTRNGETTTTTTDGNGTTTTTDDVEGGGSTPTTGPSTEEGSGTGPSTEGGAGTTPKTGDSSFKTVWTIGLGVSLLLLLTLVGVRAGLRGRATK